MKNYKIWLVIVLALLAVNSLVLAVMWFHKGPAVMARNDDHRRMEPKDVLINTLSLTTKQQEQYTVMRNKHMLLTHKLNDENHALRDSLFDNIKKPKVDTLLINSLSKKISDNQSLIEQATLYHFRELRGILTADQQVKFDGIIAQVLQMMGRPGPMQGPANSDNHPDGTPLDGDKRREHFGPPPNGMPPPGADRRRGHHRPPPDGMPPDGNGPPPDGPPPY